MTPCMRTYRAVTGAKVTLSSPPSPVAVLATVVQAPPSYPWGQEYLLVRPDQHIAWRAGDAAEIDLDVVTGAAD